jgi:hypothetical protein
MEPPYLDDSSLAAAEQIARKRQKRGDNPLAEVIARFNRRYAVVNEAGKAVVYERRLDPVLERQVLVRIEFEALRKFYMNKQLTITVLQSPRKPRQVTKSEAEWWLSSEQRRQYLDGVVFDPTGRAPPTYWNLWSGFAVEPHTGDWSLMENHIYEVICSRNDEHADYVLNWMGGMFKHPNNPGEVALVLRGKKGSGKGLLGHWIRRAWGPHAIHITNAKHLVGNFNAHLRDCVFLFADEAFYAGDKQHEGVLKGLITEPTLPIEGKYQNVISVVNMLHILMASNSDWVVPATHDDRRYAVFDVSDHRLGQRAEYFDPVLQQMREGGLAAMIHDLLRRDISRFDVRDFPSTEALAEQKKHSLDSLQRWWAAVLERGFLYQTRHGIPWFKQWHDFYTTELLWQSYTQWCNTARPFDRKSRVQLGAMMNSLYPPSRPATNTPFTKSKTSMSIPHSSMARDKFAAIYGVTCQQPDEPGDDTPEQGPGQGHDHRHNRPYNRGNGVSSSGRGPLPLGRTHA